MLISVYICPTPGCGDYFGHSGMRDLDVPAPCTTEDRHVIKAETGNEYRHLRSECPTCRRAGRGSVARVRLAAQIVDPRSVLKLTGTA